MTSYVRTHVRTFTKSHSHTNVTLLLLYRITYVHTNMHKYLGIDTKFCTYYSQIWLSRGKQREWGRLRNKMKSKRQRTGQDINDEFTVALQMKKYEIEEEVGLSDRRFSEQSDIGMNQLKSRIDDNDDDKRLKKNEEENKNEDGIGTDLIEGIVWFGATDKFEVCMFLELMR